MKSTKWKVLLALVVVWVAFFMDWDWVWGVLFILWTIPALITGRTHLLEEVSRDRHPVLFGLIISTWILLSVYLIVSDLMGRF